MQQRLEDEHEARQRGYRPEEYAELVRRAERIRADREGRVSRETLAESAAEVGISEEDLKEAERQLRLEKQERARRSAARRTAAIVAAVLLALSLIFTYNGLNSRRLDVVRARADLQATLQRRADLIPQLARVVREGAGYERDVVERLARAREGLLSRDLGAQLRANSELNRLLALAESNPQIRGTELYQDLMTEIAGAENRINVARQRYNQRAIEYNRAAQSFPTNLLRPLVGMPRELPVFQPSADVESPPRF